MDLFSDALYLTINGAILADAVLAETWTDKAGKRHAAGEIILAPNARPEFDFEGARAQGAVLVVDAVRGSTGDRVRFDGSVSRAGMRHAVKGQLLVTFQIDEVDTP